MLGMGGLKNGSVGRVRLWRRCVMSSMAARCCWNALWSVVGWCWGRGEEDLLCREVGAYPPPCT